MEQLKEIIYWITGTILCLILLGSLALTFKLSSIELPTPPTLTNSSNSAEQDSKSKEIANYKELTQVLQAQQTNVFDFVILQTLLPIFSSILTILLTYIFAKTALSFYDIYLQRKINKP